jgi:hypothetical protein
MMRCLREVEGAGGGWCVGGRFWRVVLDGDRSHVGRGGCWVEGLFLVIQLRKLLDEPCLLGALKGKRARKETLHKIQTNSELRALIPTLSV